MVLPGWNVSEPVQLALKLYEVGEALKKAPDGAKAFTSKVKGFQRALKVLQQTLEEDAGNRVSVHDLDHLQATVVDCQECVDRCEKFSEPFQDLVRDGRGGWIRAGQRVRLVWQEKTVAKLSSEIDSHVASITLHLNIKN